jgi:hypothetical protein
VLLWTIRLDETPGTISGVSISGCNNLRYRVEYRVEYRVSRYQDVMTSDIGFNVGYYVGYVDILRFLPRMMAIMIHPATGKQCHQEHPILYQMLTMIMRFLILVPEGLSRCRALWQEEDGYGKGNHKLVKFYLGGSYTILDMMSSKIRNDIRYNIGYDIR